jgi:hypothetical protein
MNKKEYELSEKWPGYKIIAKISFSGLPTSRLLICNSDTNSYEFIMEKSLRLAPTYDIDVEIRRLKYEGLHYNLVQQQQLVNSPLLYLTRFATYLVYDDLSFKSYLISRLI